VSNPDPIDYDAWADEVIRSAFPSYEKPLRAAHDRFLQGGPARPAALRVLKHLSDRYPHALRVGGEYVLALLQSGRRPDAEAALAGLRERFPELDEESLSRLGRLHRDLAFDYLKAGTGSPANNRLADERFAEALDYYQKASRVRSPHPSHYPGRNVAALLLLRAWVAPTSADRDRLRSEGQEAARRLLGERSRWPHDYPDDNIWHAATEADLNLLLGQWDAALDFYRGALGAHNRAPFHGESIGQEVRRLIRPLTDLLGMPPETANALKELFPEPSDNNPQARSSS
jgi:tetratricopeptide (TPR) repeat protein